jgi:lipopolysaccharide transport system permease protein
MIANTATGDRLALISEPLPSLLRHRRLTFEMAKREITERYSGQVLGLFWTFGHPIVMMGVYLFMFIVVMRVRIGGTPQMPFDYTTYLLSGLIPWLCFQEALQKSAQAFVNHSHLVKQAVFPIEILPVKGTLACLWTMVVFLGLLTPYVLLRGGGWHWTFLFIPVLVATQTLAMIGASYVFAAIAVYFRDTKDFLQVFCTTAVYFMPIFYLPEQVPSILRPIIYLNPFSYLVWCYQDAIAFGRFEHPYAWVVVFLGSPILFVVGYRFFRKLEPMFGNVL